jgi:2-alkenal reductase
VPDRLTRLVLIAAVLLFACFVARPYLELLLVPPVPRAVEPRGQLADFERTTIEIFQRASPSVIQVVGHVAGQAAGFEEDSAVQTGTGFIWDVVGHAVTNNHVVAGTTGLVVRLASGKVTETTVIGTAPNYDLAVIRLQNPGSLPAPLAIGSSSDLQVGQSAFAIGNPYGLNQSLTTGVVSALKRRLPTSGGREIANVIQTDAAINPGNSGGPLLDSAGRLIGVNTAILSPSGTSAGIGLAIPVDVVNRIVPELIQSGRVPTPGIGVVAASEAAATHLGVEGVVVVRTMAGSPAQQAGLRGADLASGTIGDVIVAVNGHEVRSLADLTDQFEQVGIGHTAQVTVARGARRISLDVNIIDVSRS